MAFSKRAKIQIPVALLVLIAVGVLFYPEGRRVAGDYRLVKLGNGTAYQLQDTRQPENQLGNQGNVVRIGWNDNFIVVNRLDSPTKGTPWSNEAGWVVIDVNRHTTSTTMTDAQLAQRASVAQIQTFAPAAAYEKGHRW